MSKLVIDIECTIKNKGNPFTMENELVVVGVLNVETGVKTLYWHGALYGLQERINEADLLIGFNIKFDLHWLRRTGINIDLLTCKVWDCQLAEFLLNNQSTPYPSLNNTCIKYGLPTKIDVVKEEYWEKGIDTTSIPTDILADYLNTDLDLTKEVYLKQLPQLEDNLLRLFSLQCQDLLVLEDMEYNGMVFDVDKSLQLAEEEEDYVVILEEYLKEGYENIPINWDSKDHLSCYLYGGTITEVTRLPVGVYKTGAKIGQPRYKLVEYKYELPQLVQPTKGSELKKEGYYATNDTTLRSIKGTTKVRRTINVILERSKSFKLASTYYRGIPKLIEEMGWSSKRLHGQFNQCVAATGRLSSNNPNLQNFAKQVKQLLISRYN